MPIYRALLGFAGNNQGWTEIHQLRSTETRPRLLKSLMQSMAQKRADFLGTPYAVNAFRVSAYLNDDGTRAPRASFFIRQTFTTSTPPSSKPAEPGDVALIARGTTTDKGNQNTTFWGAPPDAAVDRGGNVILGNANLQTDTDNYIGFLIANGFGWGESGAPADNEIKTITQNIDGTVTFQFKANVLLPAQHTIYYPARVRGINKGHSPLCGACNVTVIDADKVRTQEVIAFSTSQVGGFVKIYPQLRQFLPYFAIDVELIVGNHKRGRPFGSTRGRAPARVRG